MAKKKADPLGELSSMAPPKEKKSKKKIAPPPKKRELTPEQRSVEDALVDIEKRFGEGAVMRMGKRRKREMEVIPSGSIRLDEALGVGGYPRGRIVEIFGPESSGKTTLTLHAIANAQAMGLQVAFVDAEHALDPSYAEKIGVNLDDLIISQPDFGEQALEIVEALVRSGGIGVVVVDSVAALVPSK